MSTTPTPPTLKPCWYCHNERLDSGALDANSGSQIDAECPACLERYTLEARVREVSDYLEAINAHAAEYKREHACGCEACSRTDIVCPASYSSMTEVMAHQRLETEKLQARVKELESEVAKQAALFNGAMQTAGSHAERVEELEAFARNYGVHLATCPIAKDTYGDCDCGYDEARKALNL